MTPDRKSFQRRGRGERSGGGESEAAQRTQATRGRRGCPMGADRRNPALLAEGSEPRAAIDRCLPFYGKSDGDRHRMRRAERVTNGASTVAPAGARGGCMTTSRTAKFERTTKETEVSVELALDGGAVAIDVPNGFFGHMLEAVAVHGGLGLLVKAKGDTHVDLHHTVEDVGLALGEALDAALGERRGVVRFAHAYAPLDEALARAVVDLSGRGFFAWRVPKPLAPAFVTREFPLTLIADFGQALADRGRLTLHLDVLAGRNPHHVAEACFKALALALRGAVARRPGDGAVPSTKGALDR